MLNALSVELTETRAALHQTERQFDTLFALTQVCMLGQSAAIDPVRREARHAR